MLRANYHTHTTFCDGKNTPEEIVKAAIEAGMEHLGFSGHVDVSPVMDVQAYLAETRRVQEKYKDQIDILCGGELDNLYSDRNPPGFDYLIGSVHHFRFGDEILAIDWKEDMFLHLLNDYYGGEGYKLCRDYFRIVAETYGKEKCDWIGHYDLITKFNDQFHFVDENDKRYLDTAIDVLEYLVKEGLPLEINTKLAEKGRIYPGRIILTRLKEFGGQIIISSDAHRAEDLLHGFDRGKELARECGFHQTLILAGEHGKIVFKEDYI